MVDYSDSLGDEETEGESDGEPEGVHSPQSSHVKMFPWVSPKADYLRSLHSVSSHTEDHAEQLYKKQAKYAVENTSFYLDTGELLYKKGLNHLGLRILG